MKSISAVLFLSLATLSTLVIATSGHEPVANIPDNLKSSHAVYSTDVSCESSLSTGTVVPTATALSKSDFEGVPTDAPQEIPSSTSDCESANGTNSIDHLDPVNDCYDDEVNPVLDELPVDQSFGTPLPSGSAALLEDFDPNVLSSGVRNFVQRTIFLLLIAIF